MPTVDELLKKYNVSLEKELPVDADSLLTKYGVSIEEPSPFKAEFAPVEPATTMVRPEAPVELPTISTAIEELPPVTEKPSMFKQMLSTYFEAPEQAMTMLARDTELQQITPATILRMYNMPFTLGREAIKRPHIAVKAAIQAMQKVGEEVEVPITIKDNFKTAIYAMGSAGKSFWGGLAGRKDVSGRDIIKNMGIPIDDPEWARKNPAGSLAAEFLAPWYEISTDPIVWYQMAHLNRLAYASRVGKSLIKTLKASKEASNKVFENFNISKSSWGDLYYKDKTGTYVIKTIKKLHSELEKNVVRYARMKPASVKEMRNAINQMNKWVKQSKLPSAQRAITADMFPVKVKPPVPPTIPKKAVPAIIKPEVVAEPTIYAEEIAKLKKDFPELAKMAEKEAVERFEKVGKEPFSWEKKIGEKYEKELKTVGEKLKGKDYTPEKFEKATEAKEKISPVRKGLIHILARKKGLIYKSEKTGKLMRGRFNKVLKNYSAENVISVNKLMNNADADHIIEMINMFPDWREGMRRPVIPITKKIVTKEWFDTWNKTLLKKKEPTPITYVTPQWYTALKLGFGKVVKPIWEGKLSVTHYHRQLSKELDDVGKRINKMYGATIKERAIAFKRNIPTNAYQKMAKLLDTYEEAPEALSEKERGIFNYFRDKTRDYIEQENAIRKQLKLKPIRYRKAYLRHVSTETSKEMLNGLYPIPENVKYYMKDVIGKKVWNPTEFNRKLERLSDDIYKIFSRDPVYAMKSLSWHALKEIHLSVPLNYMRETLNVLGDKIPARAKSWFVRYVNETVKGQMPDFDAGMNKLIHDSGIEGFLNFFLRKFGRTLGYNPIKTINSKFSRLVHISLLSAVPRLIVRNLFQFVQDIGVYPIRDVVQSYTGLAPAEVKKWAKESMFLKTYSGFELIPKDAWSALPRLGLLPYQASALFNARKGYLVAGTAAYRLYQNPSWKAKGWTLDRVKEEAEFGAKLTQYWYHLMGMPQVFRLKALTPFTILQSWWMNHIFGLDREIITRIFTGKTHDNIEIPLSWKIGLLRYAILGVPFLVWMGYKRSTILGVLPSNMAPMAEFMFGFYAYIVGSLMGGDKGDAMKKKGKRKMLYSYKALIPYSNAWRTFMKQWHGAPWKDIFIYPKEKTKEGETSLERARRERLK